MASRLRRTPPPQNSAADAAEQLAELAARLYRLLRTALDDDPAAPSLEQLRVLTRIDTGVHYVSSLAVVRQMGMSAITSLLDASAERGWISRTPETGDRRRTRVELTASGRSALELGRSLSAGRMRAILTESHLGADNLLAAIEALRYAVDRYDEQRLQRPPPRRYGRRTPSTEPS